MKHIYLFCLISIFVSCNSGEYESKKRELELKERELELREREIRASESQKVDSNESRYNSGDLSSKKFSYVVFSVKQPRLEHMDEQYLPGTGTEILGKKLPAVNIVKYEDFVYSTDIREFVDLDEDSEYKFMDEMEQELRKQIAQTDVNYINDVHRFVDDFNERSRKEEIKSQIIDRKIKTFSSYKEASLFKESHKGSFE
jgi:hypothetical protein